LIGWDEILEGGLPPRATVMSWRGMEGGVAAASSGHDVVMCPTTHYYFDYDYERTPLDKLYAFEPVSKELTSPDRAHVLGAQANFWSHIDRPERRVDHQIYPRLLALAERVWSSAQARDYNDFATPPAAAPRPRCRLRTCALAGFGIRDSGFGIRDSGFMPAGTRGLRRTPES
jgi:hexosaminidase